MVTKELLDFLSAEHEAGMSREEMERLLVSEGGWDKGDVEEALAELHIASAVPLDASTPPVPPVQEISVAPTLRTVAFEPGIIQSAAVPEEKVLQVIHGPKEPVHEDFLGILEPSAGSSQKEPAVPPALDELLAPVSMPEEKAPAPVALAPVIESKPVAAQPAESTFKFNLAAINGDDTVKEAPAAAQAAPIMQPAQPATKPEPALPKEIKTSSGAEMWLSSAGQKSDGSQQTTEAQKMTEEAKYPPRSSVRSMNQDILLRGRGSSVPGMPAMVAPMTEDEKLMSQTPEQKAKIQKDKEIQDAKVAEQKAKEEMKRNKPVESDEVKKSRVKKIISTAIGVVVLLALVVGAFTLFSSVRGPDIPTLLSGAITNFISAQSFAYSGTASSGIVLSAATDGVMRSGDVGFALAINGELKNGPDGFGDGTHHARFVGGLHSGEYNWTTDVESDFRMIGNILYFHVLSYPTQSNLDPEVFKTYWIKIDVPEIVKELALTSGATADDYGTLAGGGDRATDFFAILSKDMPWKGGAKVGTEKIGGVDTVRIKA